MDLGAILVEQITPRGLSPAMVVDLRRLRATEGQEVHHVHSRPDPTVAEAQANLNALTQELTLLLEERKALQKSA